MYIVADLNMIKLLLHPQFVVMFQILVDLRSARRLSTMKDSLMTLSVTVSPPFSLLITFNDSYRLRGIILAQHRFCLASLAVHHRVLEVLR